MVEEALLKEKDVIADRSDKDAVSGELVSETAADESDVGAFVGEVDCARGTVRTDGEPSADASNRNAMAVGSDMLRFLGLGKNSRLK